MARTACLLAALAVAAGTPFAPRATAQAPNPAPPAIPTSAPDFDPLSGLPRPPDRPRSLMAPAPAGLYDSSALPGPYFEPDPLLDPPQLPPPGWFADVDLLYAKPHVKNELSNANIQGLAPDVFRLPSAPLEWSVAPRFELGRRLPSGFGEFSLSYQFLTTQGNGYTQGLDGPAVLKSRLDLNLIDLDYANREFSLWPNWDMKWRIGGRLGYAYFDSRADEPFAVAAAGSGIFEQRNSNRFVGFGPHTALELDRKVKGTGVSLYGKTDFWIDLGRITQDFHGVSTAVSPGGVPQTTETRGAGAQAVPVSSTQAGLRWLPTGCPNAQVFLGYQYEYWWNVGRFSATPDSRGELSDQGVLLRAEINF